MKLDTLEVPKHVAKQKLDAVRRELRRRRKPRSAGWRRHTRPRPKGRR